MYVGIKVCNVKISRRFEYVLRVEPLPQGVMLEKESTCSHRGTEESAQASLGRGQKNE